MQFLSRAAKVGSRESAWGGMNSYPGQPVIREPRGRSQSGRRNAFLSFDDGIVTKNNISHPELELF